MVQIYFNAQFSSPSLEFPFFFFKYGFFSLEIRGKTLHFSFYRGSSKAKIPVKIKRS